MYFADAFYTFDNNTLDLYTSRNGVIIGGPVNYVQGYFVNGSAISLIASPGTHIEIRPAFDIKSDTSFTVEGFFMLGKSIISATLVQLTPYIRISINNNKLTLSLASNNIINSILSISTNQWYHFGFVYDAMQQTASIYIDGQLDASKTSVQSQIVSNTNNFSIIVGTDFYGYIDQLAINLKAKSQFDILWDATTIAYYPFEGNYSFDGNYVLDKGPLGINGKASNIIPVFGWLHRALNFNNSNSNFETGAFTVQAIPIRAFTVALWVRVEGRFGPLLTIANDNNCLLVLGLEDSTNRLIAYSPNSTTSGIGVSVNGPIMPSVWVHVAFTWSYGNQAKLYTSGYLQGMDNGGTMFNDARNDTDNSPMTVTLGKYNGKANCHGNKGLDSSEEFSGSLDELYIFGRELSQKEINLILTPPPL